MADILERKKTAFVLWRPKPGAPPPRLVIGTFAPGNPPTLADERLLPLVQVAGFDDLFKIDAAACGLVDGTMYHYWFEVTDTSPRRNARIFVTDPFAFTVDWRLLSPQLPPPYTSEDQQPASVILWIGGELVICDTSGERPNLAADPKQASLPPNNKLVIYEMPTAWSRADGMGRDVGTFQDILSLVDPATPGANFAELSVTAPDLSSYLDRLGINALELLPPADSAYQRQWGYGTSHYLAPDFELGMPVGNSSSTANRDLSALVRGCHARGMRFIADVVMAFGRQEASQNIAFDDFCIDRPWLTPDDPDARNSRPNHDFRNGFGSVLGSATCFL